MKLIAQCASPLVAIGKALARRYSTFNWQQMVAALETNKTEKQQLAAVLHFSHVTLEHGKLSH